MYPDRSSRVCSSWRDRLINGGHGQDNINYLLKNKIAFNITKEYENGVRVGNIPNHKNKAKRSGEGQAWFPKDIGRYQKVR
nr:EndoU domain-containing protein [Paenibacillus sp. CF095]